MFQYESYRLMHLKINLPLAKNNNIIIDMHFVVNKNQ